MTTRRGTPLPEGKTLGQPKLRGLVVLVSALLALEAALYGTVAPLLPHYAQDLGLSKVAAGTLAAIYTAGLIPGSLLGGWLAARMGVRLTTVAGLALFAVASVGFGFAESIVPLDSSRGAQGFAAGLIWGGALTWLIGAAPRQRRGQLIGIAIGAAIFGTLLGPVFGTFAVVLGTQLIFSLIAVLALALIIWTVVTPGIEPSGQSKPEAEKRVITDTSLVSASWLLTLEGLSIGLVNTLIPLRLSRLGASSAAVGITFVLASALAASMSPVIGRVSDRRGRFPPLRSGLLITPMLLLLLPLANDPALVGITTILCIGAALSLCAVPASTLITEAADEAQLSPATGAVIVNLFWATGETLGAFGGAGLAQISSDLVPFAGLASLMLASRHLAARRSI